MEVGNYPTYYGNPTGHLLVLICIQDLHPGNVALARPAPEHIEQFLAKPPLEHDIQRKDGLPTPPHLPQRVSEPENIGFSPGDINIIDFGYSFRPVDGVYYDSSAFPTGTPPPPELLARDKKTDQPFKADSWYLGQLVRYRTLLCLFLSNDAQIYFVLTDGWPIFPRHIIATDDMLKEYNYRLAELENGRDDLINKLSEDVQSRFTPLILALLNTDPSKRPSIKDLGQSCALHAVMDFSRGNS